MGRILLRASELFSILGGFVLLGVTAWTVASVIGRTGFNAPFLGDSEIVEVGVAFSIFSFMAYCQMRGANVMVDFFTARTPLWFRRGLDAIGGIIFAFVVLILTWRLFLGGIDAFNRGDFSMFLRIPIWWGYVGAVISSVLWALVCVYTAFFRLPDERLDQANSGG